MENKYIETRTKNVSAQFSMLTNFIYKYNTADSDVLNEYAALTEDISAVFLSRIQVVNRDFNIISDSYHMNQGKLCISADINECFNGVNKVYTDKKNQCIVLTQSIRAPGQNDISLVLFGTASVSDIYSALESARITLISVSIILVLIIIALAITGSYQLVKPFKNIEKTIENISAQGTAEKISMDGCSEVRAISDSFNTMINRINQLEASRQEFVSNVSHELKTPITSMKVLAESLVGQEGMPEELYQEFLGDIVSELDRENNIITDLLTLVKMDSASQEMSISAVNINELIEAQLKLLRPIAREKNIELVLESLNPVIAEIDETKFSICISNLVVNAIKYNNVDGWVHVSLNSDKTFFYVKVQDNGYGIPEEAQEHIFDRFYRVDKARDRAAGGSGLGLAITKRIVVLHNGTIKVYSEVDKGSTFIMQIPLTYVKE